MSEVLTFTPAKRERVGLSIALAGASGSGKTKSALELATGLAGPDGRILVIDTEGRRALHYAGAYRFDHCDFAPPYSPERFTAAIVQAQTGGYDVVIVDSFSDEWEGEGGLQDIHDEEQRRLCTYKGEFNEWKMEAMNAPAWKVPKTRHKSTVIRRLRSFPGFVVFCLRAEEKIRFEKVVDEKTGREKTAIVPAGWMPVCEKRLMFDMTLSFTLAPGETRGMPRYDLTCKVPDDFVPLFPENRYIGRAAGEWLRAWATGAPLPASQIKAGGKPIDIPTVEPGVLPEEFKDPRAFVEWSELYLKGATPNHARAWEAKYRERIAAVKARSAEAAADLMALFHERAPADPADMFPGDLPSKSAA